MRKLLLLAATAALQINLQAQAVPNGTFEFWTSTAYNDPTGWNSGNKRDLGSMGSASVSKVAGFSGFALRIETYAVGPDTSESYVINTANPCNDPPSWTGGVPYSQLPTAITGYYRYNLPGNDTAIMLVIFRKNGLHVGDNLIKIKGTGSQPTFAPFSFPLTCSVIPDSMIIAAASSNKITNTGIQNGSFIEFDNLAFTGTTQIIPNGNFENWDPKSYDLATGWEMWGEGASRTTGSYAGSYAIRLETIGETCGGVNPSGITTGQNSEFSGPVGGKPYTGTTDTLCGYYKYTAMGSDSGAVYISLTNNGNPVGGAIKQLPAAASYTYFEIPFSAFSTPDTMRIDIQSSTWPADASNNGSVLYIDNLWLKSSPLGLPENGFMQSSQYPNPARDLLTVQFEKNLPNDLQLYLFDAAGRKVDDSRYERTANLITIDVSDLATGIYFYEIRTADGTTRNKFVKE